MKSSGSQKLRRLLLFALAAATVSCEQPPDDAPRPTGYVLKPGEGEVIFSGEDGSLLLKASPKTGTQGALMVYDEMPEGGTSGVHYHLHADEFFYVREGRGTIMLGDRNVEVAAGDVIVVPVGQDHKITSSADDPLTVVFFLDRPGLDEQFRLEKAINRDTMTIEAFNAIVRRYGTVYKTFR